VALAAAAGLLVLGAVLVYLLVLKKEPDVVPAPPPAPVAVRPPQPPAAERLEAAKLHVARGEWNPARQILRTLTFEDQGSLSPEGCRTLSALQETLVLAALASLPEDLATGLEKGDFALLQSAVAAAVEEGVVADLPADVRTDFDRARSLVELYGQAQAAGAAGRHQEVLERFAALDEIVPEVTDSEGLRDRAAAELEAEAEALIREARYDAGIAKLAPIVSAWPDRPGLEELVSQYQIYKENEAVQVDMLTRLPRSARSRKPHEGIEAIDEIEPTPHLAPRFAEERRKLEDQLRQLDRNPPEIVLRDGFYLEYSRGTPVELSFRASDDYQVEKVQLFARVGRAKMSEMPLEATRSGTYTVLIRPGYHNNSTVDFYVVATDKSGHLGYFGTPETPKQLTRRQ
jgi:tetratricopeptide (TPR) repeat protein